MFGQFLIFGQFLMFSQFLMFGQFLIFSQFLMFGQFLMPGYSSLYLLLVIPLCTCYWLFLSVPVAGIEE
jgi:hypothetical protein